MLIPGARPAIQICRLVLTHMVGGWAERQLLAEAARRCCSNARTSASHFAWRSLAQRLVGSMIALIGKVAPKATGTAGAATVGFDVPLGGSPDQVGTTFGLWVDERELSIDDAGAGADAVAGMDAGADSGVAPHVSPMLSTDTIESVSTRSPVLILVLCNGFLPIILSAL